MIFFPILAYLQEYPWFRRPFCLRLAVSERDRKSQTRYGKAERQKEPRDERQEETTRANPVSFRSIRLEVVQQPQRARMCGFGDKVRVDLWLAYVCLACCWLAAGTGHRTWAHWRIRSAVLQPTNQPVLPITLCCAVLCFALHWNKQFRSDRSVA